LRAVSGQSAFDEIGLGEMECWHSGSGARSELWKISVKKIWFERTEKMLSESVRMSGVKKICGDITKKCKKLNLYIDSKHI